MDFTNIKTKCNRYLLYLIMAVISLISACGGGSNTTTSGSGSIAINIIWSDSISRASVAQAEKIDCDALGVNTIQVRVYNQNGDHIKSSSLWRCDSHEGTLSEIKAGSNYTVVALFRESNNENDSCFLHGETRNVNVLKGNTANVTIEAKPFVPEPLSPTDSYVFFCDNTALEWNAVADAATYEISISENSDMANATTYSTTNTSYAPADLIENTLYYWQVKAQDAYNNKGRNYDTRNFTAGNTGIFKDISPGTSGSYPNNMIVIDNILYFSATDQTGAHLWKYDSTSDTVTKIVINQSGGSSPYDLIEYNNELFCSASDGSDRELWRYDGNNAYEIDVDGTGSSSPSGLTIYNGNLYFSAADNSGGSYDRELYRFDGTTAEKIDINPSGSSSPYYLTVANNALYFSASDGSDTELWEWDGTTETEFDINPSGSSSPSSLTESNNILYFRAWDGTDHELYRYAGGSSPTKIDINPNPNGSSSPSYLTDLDGILYFTATNDGLDTELFRYPGTGTTATKIDINPNGSSYPQNLTSINGVIYFSASLDSIGREPFYYDEDTATYNFFKDIRGGNDGSYPSGFTGFNGRVYFEAASAENGSELWYFDPIGETTWLEEEICVGSCSSYPSNLTSVNLNGVPTLFFSANDGIDGAELWATTSSGTEQVKDINQAGSGIAPHQLTEVNGKLFFVADDGSSGAELWVSNGTASGTRMAIDINPGPDDSHPYYLTEYDGKIYFRATMDGTDYELFVYEDGGTSALEIEINTNDSSYPSNFVVSNNILYFRATGNSGTGLWKYDGTDLTKITDPPLDDDYVPSYLTDVNGTLYFSGVDTSGDRELYKYNGTTLTRISINNSGSSSPNSITAVGNDVYFRAANNNNEYHLWRYENQASLDEIIINNSGSSSPSSLTAMSGSLYFTAYDGTQRDLYEYDGSNLNMVDVATPGDRYFSKLFSTNDMLYFLLVGADTYTYQLWSLGISSAGATMIKELGTPDYYYPFETVTLNNKVYISFVGDYYYSFEGFEIWESDGTEQNTLILAESDDYNIPYFDPELEQVGGALFFIGYTAQYGPELWKHCP